MGEMKLFKPRRAWSLCPGGEYCERAYPRSVASGIAVGCGETGRKVWQASTRGVSSLPSPETVHEAASASTLSKRAQLLTKSRCGLVWGEPPG